MTSATTTTTSSLATVLSRLEWEQLAGNHAEQADALTAGRRYRVERGLTHPVDDFLFTYYGYKPAILRRWHPGAGVVLADAGDTPRASWRWYQTHDDVSVSVNSDAYFADKSELSALVQRMLSATAARPGQFGCFGLHEWAMVYRQDGHRHTVPLRLGQAGTDDVVESHELRCTHYDAVRFFTPDALPRNREITTRAAQPLLEQPGCLHANMDVYKWALKLGPLVPGHLLLEAFVLARDIRELDMAASPYDLSDWGVTPVQIETAHGKSEYVRAQRRFAERGNHLRSNILAALPKTHEDPL